MSLTTAERVDIRRYCGFPVFGNQPTQGFGYRYFQWYGTLEWRMLNGMAEEEAVVRTTFLANLRQLEKDVYGVRDNSDTSAAAVWKRNPDELRERMRNYSYWRHELCKFYGIGAGPGLGSNSSSIEMVV